MSNPEVRDFEYWRKLYFPRKGEVVHDPTVPPYKLLVLWNNFIIFSSFFLFYLFPSSCYTSNIYHFIIISFFYILGTMMRYEDAKEFIDFDAIQTPAQMHQLFLKLSSIRRKQVPNAEDGHVGTAGTTLSKSMVFKEVTPFAKAYGVFLKRGDALSDSAVKVSVDEVVTEQTVHYPHVSSVSQSSEADDINAGATVSEPVYTPLPISTMDKVRILQEQGFCVSTTVALIMNVMSYVGQNNSVISFNAILDGGTTDFTEALQVGWYMDLSNLCAKVICAPLVNTPLNMDIEDYLNKLYLMTVFYNAKGFRTGTPMFSYGVRAFSEYKPSINNDHTKICMTWEDVQKRQPKGESIVSGLNLLSTIQKENTLFKDLPSTNFCCRSSNNKTILLKDSKVVLPVPSTSFRMPALPKGLEYRGNQFQHLQGQGPISMSNSAPTFTKIVMPTMVQGNLLNTDISTDAQIDELYGTDIHTIENLVPSSFNPKMFVGQHLTSVTKSFARSSIGKGTILLYVDVKSLLDGTDISPILLQNVLTGHLALEVRARVSVVKTVAFPVKLVYDESAQLATEGTYLSEIRPLPGVSFSSQETSGALSFCIESNGTYVDFSNRINFGAIVLASLSEPNVSTIDMPSTLNAYIDFWVKDIESFTYSVGQSPLCQVRSICAHYTIATVDFACNVRDNFVSIAINPWDSTDVYCNTLQNFSAIYEGYSCDFVLSWNLATAMLSAGELYIFPVYDNQIFTAVSKNILDQSHCHKIETTEKKSGRLFIPFHSWFGCYNNENVVRIGFYAPSGISGVENEIAKLTLQIEYAHNFQGRGYSSLTTIAPSVLNTTDADLDMIDNSPEFFQRVEQESKIVDKTTNFSKVVKPVYQGSSSNFVMPTLRVSRHGQLMVGQGPFNHLESMWVHCADVTQQFLQKSCYWFVPVSPHNMANRVFMFDDNDNYYTAYAEGFSTNDNWLHYLAKANLYWRGSLEYQLRVSYTTRQAASVPLMAYYTSRPTLKSGFSNRSVLQSYPVAFTTDSCFTLSINVPFCATNKLLSTVPYGTLSDVQRCFNGLLIFRLPGDLLTTSSIAQIQLFMRPGKDFMLSRFRLAARSSS